MAASVAALMTSFALLLHRNFLTIACDSALMQSGIVNTIHGHWYGNNGATITRGSWGLAYDLSPAASRSFLRDQPFHRHVVYAANLGRLQHGDSHLSRRAGSHPAPASRVLHRRLGLDQPDVAAHGNRAGSSGDMDSCGGVLGLLFLPAKQLGRLLRERALRGLLRRAGGPHVRGARCGAADRSRWSRMAEAFWPRVAPGWAGLGLPGGFRRGTHGPERALLI